MPNKFFPSLADLSQDIAGQIPLELVKAWLESAQDSEAEQRLLAPYKKFGTIVCSDSAGLSKLSRAKTLLEVMKLVNEPKEIIFSHGKAIGGQAVGMWIADNTQMFYDESIHPKTVVEQMIAAQRAIAPLTVQVGLGIHQGSVYEIGGGLYGAEADDIEAFTEEETKAGEVAVSTTVLNLLGDEMKIKERRGDKHVLALDDYQVKAITVDDINYPTPFPKAFHEAIRQLNVTDQSAVKQIDETYLKNTTVILLHVFHEAAAGLLDGFVAKTAASSIIYKIAKDFKAHVVSINGTLAIAVLNDAREAVAFAHGLFDALRQASFTVNIGLCQGEILFFDFGDGTWNLAGNPVNIASKLAEDTDERNAIFLEESVTSLVDTATQAVPFSIGKSGVTIKGDKLIM